MYHSFITEEFNDFVQSWFSLFTERLNGRSNGQSVGENYHAIDKRHVAPPPNFEDVEKLFLVNQSMDYLYQFVGYIEYVTNNTNEVRSALEEMLNLEGSRLLRMSTAELQVYAESLKSTMETGVNADHELTINGKTYSLDHISNWCCQFG